MAPSVARTTPTASLVIPAYDEEQGLDAVLTRIGAERIPGLEVIVVDDGSTDGTARVAEGHGTRLISHRANRGKGAAVQTGLESARAPRVVVMDADDTYPVEAIPGILELLATHDHVRGVRRSGRTNIPPVNRLGNALIALAVRLACGVRSTDPLTGLYGLHTADLEHMGLTSTGFGLETEIAIKSARMKLRTADYPIRYGARLGHSKLSPLRDGFVILATILSLAWTGLRSRSKAPQTR